ncbi:Protein PHOTOPERIOD-INDEPENDENT EARLY FLOWERING 1 [Fragariocoptes setiger]|uniref:Protein PHOTOPERIOD-INDEPENDENT EARLY FLOWERING 1 n=1 Tax=Fragariocoptes setiger TaxID=1670756 RepID=A0ABQ7S6H5_9ACAR|nr:Protein PHOTOPERIOD-INDEPENDENT EARLY FLOWERING 1 [Fragariocoptes setiger]
MDNAAKLNGIQEQYNELRLQIYDELLELYFHKFKSNSAQDFSSWQNEPSIIKLKHEITCCEIEDDDSFTKLINFTYLDNVLPSTTSFSGEREAVAPSATPTDFSSTVSESKQQPEQSAGTVVEHTNERRQPQQKDDINREADKTKLDDESNIKNAEEAEEIQMEVDAQIDQHGPQESDRQPITTTATATAPVKIDADADRDARNDLQSMDIDATVTSSEPTQIESQVKDSQRTPLPIHCVTTTAPSTQPKAVNDLSASSSTLSRQLKDIPRTPTSTQSAILSPSHYTHSHHQPDAALSPSPQQSTLHVRSQPKHRPPLMPPHAITNRVTELIRQGLWSQKRLPKVHEPARPRVHWDFLLEEMQWLATDFAQERRYKKALAKKCAKMVGKYHSDKRQQKERAERMHIQNLKRIASTIAKEIRVFWSTIEKVVDQRQQSKLDEKRKRALDLHLKYIVDQTEKFSSEVQKSFTENLKAVATTPIMSSNVSDEENTQTMENVESRLAEDSKMICDEDNQVSRGVDKMSCEDDKSSCNEDDTDEESDVTDDESEEMEEASEDDEESVEGEADDDEGTIDDENGSEEDEGQSESTSSDKDDDANVGIEYLINPDTEKSNEEPQPEEQSRVEKSPVKKETAKKDIKDIAAGAESIQPKGNTLETTTVCTKVPSLLKHTLREYQHIGLDWLVAMYNKKLNGILADEMGLGKTIQTIALLAHLACERGDWGPHLIVVPTSVMLNWEMEFKKWCPAFKILTYYGTPKERRLKRQGWTKPNCFHVCITSYRLVIQDHNSFRRKKWRYLILDEAHNIKNFKSQRWQILLNFNSHRRLLLTGTPLQNDLMELWSLMHFLMPNLFDSHREFKDWFVNPVTGMIEGNNEYNETLIQRLHKVLRPFLLRRLKCDVERQLPQKYEHIVPCRLSKRQRFLYEEFMSLANTKETLAKGNFLSVINVLMQLRKVCNHPNLFEPRPIISPYMVGSIVYKIPGIVTTPTDYDPEKDVDLKALGMEFAHLIALSSFEQSRISQIRAPRNIIENLHVSDNKDEDRMDVDEVTQNDVNLSVDPIPEMSDPKFDHVSVENKRKEDLAARLKLMANLNERRCTASSFITRDVVQAFSFHVSHESAVKYDWYNPSINVFRSGNGYLFCNLAHQLRNNPRLRLNKLVSLLDTAMKSPETRLHELDNILERFVVCVPGVSARPISLHVTHEPSTHAISEKNLKDALRTHLAPRFYCLNKILVNMRTSFPELRLIQYDCGKLQTLSELLWTLKSENHRVLIFTQMSRMLDILEQFLNYHGHTYLRLDGATKIDQRQALMDRFNNDKRIFCFILSTRSGGIGVNLTGADTVIFYDSDWNPTMDAQAQDRCHRIGQTRDVHIYRLISRRTIEENILTKARQKRLLGDVAIEGGNFTTAFFKKQAIQELFNITEESAITETVTAIETGEPSNGGERSTTNGVVSDASVDVRKLEQALCKGEENAGEELDVQAANVANEDAEAELKEFDETIPLDDEARLNGDREEKSEAEAKIDMLVAQMAPIQKYAVKFLESIQEPINAEELKQAEEEIEAQKRDWELNRIESLKKESLENDFSETLLTYPRNAACKQVYHMNGGSEEMPMWAPPTPPTTPPSPVNNQRDQTSDHQQYGLGASCSDMSKMTPTMAARYSALQSIGGSGSGCGFIFEDPIVSEKDLHFDYTLNFLYEPAIMHESALPPVTQPQDNISTSAVSHQKRARMSAPYHPHNTEIRTSQLQQQLQNENVGPLSHLSVVSPTPVQARKPKIRRDEVVCLPKSLFDRQSSTFAKLRRDLKIQKLRCVTKGIDSDPFAMQKFFNSFLNNTPNGRQPQPNSLMSQFQTQPPYTMEMYQQDSLPAWTIQEEWAALLVIQQLQDLPLNLCILSPGHLPNWDFVSDVVNTVGFVFRSFRMCWYHYETIIQPREMLREPHEQRSQQHQPQLPIQTPAASQPQPQIHSSGLPATLGLAQPQRPPTLLPPHLSQAKRPHPSPSLSPQPQSKKAKKSKSQSVDPIVHTPSYTPPVQHRPSKTAKIFVNDKSFQLACCQRFEAISNIRRRRPPPLRTRFRTRDTGNTQLMNEFRVNYDRPLTPMQVARNAKDAQLEWSSCKCTFSDGGSELYRSE